MSAADQNPDHSDGKVWPSALCIDRTLQTLTLQICFLKHLRGEKTWCNPIAVKHLKQYLWCRFSSARHTDRQADRQTDGCSKADIFQKKKKEEHET